MEEKILEILIRNYPNFASNGRVAKQIVAEATKEMYPFVEWSNEIGYDGCEWWIAPGKGLTTDELFEYWKQNIRK